MFAASAVCGAVSVPGDPVAGLIGGSAVGVVAAAITLALYIRGDSHFFAVAARRANAITLQCMFGETDGWLDFEKQLQRARVADSAGTFTLTFEFGAVTLWSQSEKPKPLVIIPLANIVDIAIGQPFIRRGYNNPFYARLELAVVDSVPQKFSFAVEESGAPATAARLAFLANELKDALEGIIRVGEVRPPPRLIDGVTAWSARQLGVILLIASTAVASFLVPIAIAIGGAISPYLFALAGLVVVGAVSVLLYSTRVARRELVMGHTTLHRSHLEVEQRHPATGEVIRAAGRPALTDEELRTALARRRAGDATG